MTIIDNPNKTLTITLSVEERVVLDRAFTDHGAGVLAELVKNWLDGRVRFQEDNDITLVRAGNADASTKARVKAKLGL